MKNFIGWNPRKSNPVNLSLFKVYDSSISLSRCLHHAICHNFTVYLQICNENFGLGHGLGMQTFYSYPNLFAQIMWVHLNTTGAFVDMRQALETSYSKSNLDSSSQLSAPIPARNVVMGSYSYHACDGENCVLLLCACVEVGFIKFSHVCDFTDLSSESQPCKLAHLTVIMK